MKFHIGHNDADCLPDDPASIISADGVTEAIRIFTDELKSLASDYEQRCEGYGDPENLGAEGDEHCEWCDIYWDVYADTLKDNDWEQKFLLTPGGLSIKYSPPVGPDVVYWVAPCENGDDCDICSD
jgi:hypothetical protein